MTPKDSDVFKDIEKAHEVYKDKLRTSDDMLNVWVQQQDDQRDLTQESEGVELRITPERMELLQLRLLFDIRLLLVEANQREHDDKTEAWRDALKKLKRIQRIQDRKHPTNNVLQPTKLSVAVHHALRDPAYYGR